ncbi:MAG: Ribokinase [Phycisphaerae bacterium]|nr:Ribokinase [Phycisphaerae bacterium]
MSLTPSVVVVGSVNMDLVALGGRIPAPGETVSAREFRLVHGGKGGNQAVAAARLGANVAFIGRVGDDEFGRALRSGLTREGVECGWLGTVPNCSSGVALIHVARDGENAICVVPGANHRLTPDDIDEAAGAIQAARILIVQLEIPMETVLRAISIARQNRVRVVLDPAPAPHDAPADLLTVDILTPNATEAAALAPSHDGRRSRSDVTRGVAADDAAGKSGDAPRHGTAEPTAPPGAPESAALSLLKRGAEAVVLKLGSHGALLADKHGVRRFAARKVEVCDTTGAGDAFTAALAVAQARGQSLDAAVEFAIAAGAIACTRIGAQPSMPSAADVEGLLRSVT